MNCYSVTQLRASFFVIGAFLLTLIIGGSLLNQASASQVTPLFDRSFLDGIDTVYVGHQSGPNASLLPWPHPGDASQPDIVFLAVKESFVKFPWITVISSRTSDSTELYKPNVVVFEFITSAQSDQLNEKAIAVASLGLQILKYRKGDMESVLPLRPVTYAFVAHDTSEAFRQKLTKAAHFLTDHLPAYFPCPLNAKGKPCSSTYIVPYGEKPPSMNPEWLKGKSP